LDDFKDGGEKERRLAAHRERAAAYQVRGEGEKFDDFKEGGGGKMREGWLPIE